MSNIGWKDGPQNSFSPKLVAKYNKHSVESGNSKPDKKKQGWGSHACSSKRERWREETKKHTLFDKKEISETKTTAGTKQTARKKSRSAPPTKPHNSITHDTHDRRDGWVAETTRHPVHSEGAQTTANKKKHTSTIRLTRKRHTKHKNHITTYTSYKRVWSKARKETQVGRWLCKKRKFARPTRARLAPSAPWWQGRRAPHRRWTTHRPSPANAHRAHVTAACRGSALV